MEKISDWIFALTKVNLFSIDLDLKRNLSDMEVDSDSLDELSNDEWVEEQVSNSNFIAFKMLTHSLERIKPQKEI